jgi:hypothetical protein
VFNIFIKTKSVWQTGINELSDNQHNEVSIISLRLDREDIETADRSRDFVITRVHVHSERDRGCGRVRVQWRQWRYYKESARITVTVSKHLSVIMEGHRQNGLERENAIPASIHLLQKDGLRSRGMYFP